VTVEKKRNLKSHLANTFTIYAISVKCDMGWLQLVGSLKLLVSFAKEPYNRHLKSHLANTYTIYTISVKCNMGWLQLVGSLKLLVSSKLLVPFAKEHNISKDDF